METLTIKAALDAGLECFAEVQGGEVVRAYARTKKDREIVADLSTEKCLSIVKKNPRLWERNGRVQFTSPRKAEQNNGF